MCGCGCTGRGRVEGRLGRQGERCCCRREGRQLPLASLRRQRCDGPPRESRGLRHARTPSALPRRTCRCPTADAGSPREEYRRLPTQLRQGHGVSESCRGHGRSRRCRTATPWQRTDANSATSAVGGRRGAPELRRRRSFSSPRHLLEAQVDAEVRREEALCGLAVFNVEGGKAEAVHAGADPLPQWRGSSSGRRSSGGRVRLAVVAHKGRVEGEGEDDGAGRELAAGHEDVALQLRVRLEDDGAVGRGVRGWGRGLALWCGGGEEEGGAAGLLIKLPDTPLPSPSHAAPPTTSCRRRAGCRPGTAPT